LILRLVVLQGGQVAIVHLVTWCDSSRGRSAHLDFLKAAPTLLPLRRARIQVGVKTIPQKTERQAQSYAAGCVPPVRTLYTSLNLPTKVPISLLPYLGHCRGRRDSPDSDHE
jgi:hypothetical protein